MVARVDDDRVVELAGLLEHVHVTAEPGVDVLDHRGVVLARRRVFGRRQGALVGVGLTQTSESADPLLHLGRDVDRRMRADEVDRQVPGPVLRRRFDQVQAVAGDPVVAVGVGSERRGDHVGPPGVGVAGAPPAEVLGAGLALRRFERVEIGVVRILRSLRILEVGLHAVALAAVVDLRGEAPVIGVVRAVEAPVAAVLGQVELADSHRVVAGVAEHAVERLLVQGIVVPVVAYAAAVVLAASGQTGPGRTADRRRHQGAGEVDAVAGQAIDVRCAERRQAVAVEAEPVGPLLIGEEEEEIRSRVRYRLRFGVAAAREAGQGAAGNQAGGLLQEIAAGSSGGHGTFLPVCQTGLEGTNVVWLV